MLPLHAWLTVREDDGLHLPLDVIAVLASQHVDLALVHAQLADVRLGGNRIDGEREEEVIGREGG